MNSGRFDHIVVGAATLEQGIEWAESVLGVRVPRGGRHAKMNTHNCVMQFEGENYFEIIAIEPNSPNPEHARWFSLDNPAVQKQIALEPQLLTWAINVPDIAAAFAALEALSLKPNVRIEAMTRDALRWQVAFGTDGELIDAGLFPLVIEWDVPQHPALSMKATACSVVRIELRARNASVTSRKLDAIGALKSFSDIAVIDANRNELRVFLNTPNGEVVLSSLNSGVE
ncbi:MAG: VOC family protein [Pseudomonadota bacterium]